MPTEKERQPIQYSTACPRCHKHVFLLCEGACLKDHRHVCLCLNCATVWRARTRTWPVSCRVCGHRGIETEDDMSPELCGGCMATLLEGITERLLVMRDSQGPEIALLWLEQSLLEEAQFTEDWAPVLIERLANGLLLPTPPRS